MKVFIFVKKNITSITKRDIFQVNSFNSIKVSWNRGHLSYFVNAPWDCGCAANDQKDAIFANSKDGGNAQNLNLSFCFGFWIFHFPFSTFENLNFPWILYPKWGSSKVRFFFKSTVVFTNGRQLRQEGRHWQRFQFACFCQNYTLSRQIISTLIRLNLI